jgi:hypothetical protein
METANRHSDASSVSSKEHPSTAYRDAIITPFAEIATELQAILGQRLVAYSAGVRSMKNVGRWAAGVDPRSADVDRRVRQLYRTVLSLHRDGGLSEESTRAWLTASNPELADEAPIELLREDQGPRVFHAAKAFMTLVG